jgi:hypothetical protein
LGIGLPEHQMVVAAYALQHVHTHPEIAGRQGKIRAPEALNKAAAVCRGACGVSCRPAPAALPRLYHEAATRPIGFPANG